MKKNINESQCELRTMSKIFWQKVSTNKLKKTLALFSKEVKYEKVEKDAAKINIEDAYLFLTSFASSYSHHI